MTRRSFSAYLAAFLLAIAAVFGPRRVPVRLVSLPVGKDCRRCKERRCSKPHHVTLVRTDTGEDIGADVSIALNPPLPWATGTTLDLLRFTTPRRLAPGPSCRHQRKPGRAHIEACDCVVATLPPLPVVVVA